MEYQVEDLSPVKKKVSVQVPAEEVNAALDTTIALQKKDLKLSGFRKGKVPSSLVESRFKKEIYEQTERDLLNVHFNQIFGELGVQPLAGFNLDNPGLERDQDLNYSLSFEIKPSIDLPEYHGLKATQNKVEVTEAQVDRVISQIQHNYSELELTDEDRQPTDGDVAVIEFAAYENGEPLENIKSDSFELPLGEGQSLEDFEAIVKKLRPGQQTTEPITFPEDFINQELSGKTVDMQIELKVIKTRKLPEVDDELAEKMGAGSVQEMRERIAENLKSYRQNMEKSVTQKQLIDQLLSQVEVALPESLVESQLEYLMNSKREQLERQGKSLESLGSEEELREKYRPEAEENVKSQLVLLEVANREDLSVSNQEIEQQIMRMAINNGQDPQQLKKYYEENNLMFALRDSILADKAMEKIYEYAQIEEVEPGSSQEQQREEETGDGSPGETAEAEGE